ncbi:MAG: SdpI family protein [Patescibacteria group bacterium]|jgi:uncharacterized membrane protein
MINPLKLTWRSESPIIVLIALSAAASVWFYQNMPAIVPIHWGLSGQADGYGSRGFAAFFFPALILGLYLLLTFIPNLDPKKNIYAEFKKTYWILRLTFILFFILIYFTASLVGVGYNLPVGQIVCGGIGLLFIIIGACLTKIKPNWFVGIRTPWTLSDDIVWEKTHRLGGKLFMLAGLGFIASITLPAGWNLGLGLGVTFLAIIITVVYSYWLSRQN